VQEFAADVGLELEVFHALTEIALAGRSAAREGVVARHSNGDELRLIIDQLAAAVESEWRDEAARQRLFDPYPLSVSWLPADPEFVASWPDIVELGAGSPGTSEEVRREWATSEPRLAGGGTGLIGVLTQVPTGRLIVLGAPGAGKTILLI